jgi:hypothetical protein
LDEAPATPSINETSKDLEGLTDVNVNMQNIQDRLETASIFSTNFGTIPAMNNETAMTKLKATLPPPLQEQRSIVVTMPQVSRSKPYQ